MNAIATGIYEVRINQAMVDASLWERVSNGEAVVYDEDGGIIRSMTGKSEFVRPFNYTACGVINSAGYKEDYRSDRYFYVVSL